MLEVTRVEKSFGGVKAVRDVSLSCEKGEILGLIGPNGAGKSSLINVISGALTPTSGTVVIDGIRVEGRGPEFAACSGIARTFQNLRLFGQLSVSQNVEVALTTARRKRRSSIRHASLDAILDRYGLAGIAHRDAAELPYGHQRRVEIVRAVALAPSVILLDEPAAGMNDQETAELADIIRLVREDTGCGVIVIDHDLHFIMNLCERICVLDMGAKIAEGDPQSIRINPKVIEVYLGAAAE